MSIRKSIIVLTAYAYIRIMVYMAETKAKRNKQGIDEGHMLVRLEPALIKRMQRFQQGYRFKSRNDVIRWLLEFALGNKQVGKSAEERP